MTISPWEKLANDHAKDVVEAEMHLIRLVHDMEAIGTETVSLSRARDWLRGRGALTHSAEVKP